MSKTGQWMAVIGAVGLATAVAGEDLARRGAEGRYRHAVAERQQVELQYGEVLATHQKLQDSLAKEQGRSQELTDALGTLRGRLEEAVGRLTEETRHVQELQQRLAAMQEQMNQLQGELSLSLQHGGGPATGAPAASVELERILVRDAASGMQTGRVLSVHEAWQFIVIDLGWGVVKIGDTVSIFRDNQLLAKARIERVQEAVCAATLLPEWQAARVQVNDLVRLL